MNGWGQTLTSITFSRAYAGLGRVNEIGDPKAPPEFTGLTHMVIFVQPGEECNTTYLVDVGCGGSGPTMPILLTDAEDNVVMGTTPTEKHRLRRGAHPESSVGKHFYELLPVSSLRRSRHRKTRVGSRSATREARPRGPNVENRVHVFGT